MIFLEEEKVILTNDIKDILSPTCSVGTTKRIKEHSRNDKSVCTGTSGALVIRRIVDGWLFKCHRCGDKGKITIEGMSPKEVIQYVKKNVAPSYGSVLKVDMPSDCVYADSLEVPASVMQHLLKYRITHADVERHGIMWSAGYQRIIFPVTNTTLLNNLQSYSNFLGWIGKEPNGARISPKNPKWLKKIGMESNNFYYHIENKLIGADPIIVLVEDTISAIRVHVSTGYSVIALLGTALPVGLMTKLRDYEIKLWLDKDALDKSLKYWKTCITLGLKCKYVYTPYDPKFYSNEGIRTNVNQNSLISY